MRNLRARSKTITVLIGAAAAAATAIPALAQRPGSPPSPIERRVDQLNRQADEYGRDELNRDLKERPNKSGNHRTAAALAVEIKQDFEGLQAGYNQIVLAMTSKEALKLDSVFSAVAEIRKHSTRLRANLALPRPNEIKRKPGQDVVGPSQVEASLLNLRKYIYNFVTNPLFEAANGLNVEQATRASEDLEKIIELSDGIGRNARLKERP